MDSFLERLRRPDPLLTVEMRPPRADLSQAATMDAWLAMGSAVRRLLQRDTALFFTDNAVGANEEENLHHLVSNLEQEADRRRICPFLTTKHSLEYCLWYVDRAVGDGHAAVTVLGGDRNVGPARCVDHAYELRARIRERHPSLVLGGWANPFRDAQRQVDFLTAERTSADFYLTQVVSHHDLRAVEAFVAEARRRNLDLPGVFGVFYYRSANPRTLQALADFLPVPAVALTREFRDEGANADEICARTVRALRELGVDRVYISNLKPDDAPQRLEAIRRLVESGS